MSLVVMSHHLLLFSALFFLSSFSSVADGAQGSFTVSPSIASLGTGITVTYVLDEYVPYPYDIIAIYASGEVSLFFFFPVVLHTPELPNKKAVAGNQNLL